MHAYWQTVTGQLPRSFKMRSYGTAVIVLDAQIRIIMRAPHHGVPEKAGFMQSY